MALPQKLNPPALPEGKPVRKIKTGIILALGSMAFTLALVELALRLVGFSYRLYPEKIEFGWPNPTVMQDRYQPDNDLLWVTKDYYQRLDTLKLSPPNIIFMGDSCTEFGTYDQFFVQHALEAGHPEVKAEKLGFGGWASYQGLQQLKRDIVRLKPKIVTIYFGWNDHWMGFGIQDKEIAKLRSPLYTLLEHSRLTQLITKAVLSQEDSKDQLGLRVLLPDFEANLRGMVDAARGAGITPVLLTAPSSHRAGKEPKYLEKRHLKDLNQLVPLHQRYVDVVRKVATETGAPLCDLFTDFTVFSDEDLVKKYFNKDGIHLTKGPGEGYDKLAEFLVRCFEEKKLFSLLK